MKLAELQAQFWQALRAPENARVDVVVSTPEFSARERLQLYADMYLWRQIAALREDFPCTLGLLGEDAFVELARAYIDAHPSQRASLAKLGARLRAFVPSRPLARADVADLVALEWARAEAFGCTGSRASGARGDGP